MTVKTGIEIHGRTVGGDVLMKLADEAKRARDEVNLLGKAGDAGSHSFKRTTMSAEVTAGRLVDLRRKVKGYSDEVIEGLSKIEAAEKHHAAKSDDTSRDAVLNFKPPAKKDRSGLEAQAKEYANYQRDKERAEKEARQRAEEAEKEAERKRNERQARTAARQRDQIQGVKDLAQVTRSAAAVMVAGYDATVAKAMELRSKGDPARRDFEAFQKTVGSLQAQVGDTLVPSFRAVTQALSPLIKSTEKWFKTNEDIIGSKFTGWLVTAGKLLTGGLATAAIYTSKAIGGIKMAANVVELGVTKSFAGILDVSASVLDRFSSISQRFGKGDLASDLKAAADAARGLGAEFDRSGDDAERAILADARALEELERQVRAAEKAIDTALGTVAVRAAKNMRDEVVRSTEVMRARLMGLWADRAAQVEAHEMRAKLADELQMSRLEMLAELEAKGQDERNAVWDRGFARRIELVGRLSDEEQRAAALSVAAAELASQRRLALQERDFERAKALQGQIVDLTYQSADAMAEASRRGMEHPIGMATGALGTFRSALTGAIEEGVEGSKSATEVVGGFFKNMGRGLVDIAADVAMEILSTKLTEALIGSAVRTKGTMGYVAQAAAAGTAAAAATPILGPAIASAGGMAAAAAALAAAVSTGGFGLQVGGLVTQGSGLHDDVHARLKRNEYVITADTVRRNMAAGRAPDDSRPTTLGGGGGGAPTVALTVQANSFVPMSEAEFDRMIEQRLAPAIDRLLRARRLA